MTDVLTPTAVRRAFLLLTFTRCSTQVAMVVAGAVSVLGALLYVPALRAEGRRAGPPV